MNTLKTFILVTVRFIKKVIKMLEVEMVVNSFKKAYYGYPMSNGSHSLDTFSTAVVLPAESISSIFGRLSKWERRVLKSQLIIDEKENIFKEK